MILYNGVRSDFVHHKRILKQRLTHLKYTRTGYLEAEKEYFDLKEFEKSRLLRSPYIN